MAKTALKVAGSVFFLVALLHLSRVVFQFDVVLGGWAAPIWVNGLGFLIAGSLSLWMFKAQKSL